MLGRFARTEADALILKTARQNWKLLALNLGTSLVGALLEGGTFGIIFLAITLLTHQGNLDWSRYAVLASVPWLIDLLNSINKEWLFLGLLSIAVTAQVLLSLCNYLNQVSVGYLAATLRVKLTEKIHRQILSFSFACVSAYKVGDLASYANTSGNAVQTQLVQVNSLIANSFLLFIYTGILLAISPWLMTAGVLMGLFLYTFQRRVLPRIRQTAINNETDLVSVSKQVTENIQGLRVIHTFGYQEEANLKVATLLQKLLPGLKRQARLLNIMTPIAQALPVVMLAVLTGGAFFLFKERSTGILPSLVTFVLALQRFNIRVQTIMGNMTKLADNSGRMDRLRAILNPWDKQFAPGGGIEFPGFKTDIEFRQVGLRYHAGQAPALQDIDLVLPKGKVTALVGQSGAGKSSLADLLVGLYAPTSGYIAVNNHDLKDYSLESWRRHLGVVSQDTFVFNLSILDNIRFGRLDASECEVIEAARAAQAHGFIQELPEGYETLVGERGYRLSGGQRQRLALARAILRDPELLILDEATSALDTESERLVQEALEDFGQDRTVLVIAHRLSTIVGADQIIVLDRGRIIEQGNHYSLLSQRGNYAQYWELQAQAKVA